ncbi:hypothetical protein [Lachnospira sp.]|jgi:hypothetical protein|uniref:exo-rhamnogalacturonan lyase family protein n=1 Tax=Lachnospira sp. TaxID=2049031 RepID=UPI00257C0542|nr:hypothetical protein [Lachnospira sp.]
MVNVYFEKLYRYERKQEYVGVAIPFKKGEYFDLDKLSVVQKDKKLVHQAKVTAKYDDGSIKFAYVRFLADLAANKTCFATVLTGKETEEELKEVTGITNLDALSLENVSKLSCNVNKEAGTISVDTGALKFLLSNNSSNIFSKLEDSYRDYTEDNFVGPNLSVKNRTSEDSFKLDNYSFNIDSWRVVEVGAVSAIFEGKGHHDLIEESENGAKRIDFELRITAVSGKPYLDVAYRIINTSDNPLEINSLEFFVKADANKACDNELVDMAKALHESAGGDSTGCGDGAIDNSKTSGPVFHTRGINDLDDILSRTPVDTVRTVAARSNYKTDFYIGRDGFNANVIADDKGLLKEGNEHFAEVLYGTFFADRTDEKSGICATIYQAMQNYPKAIKADKNGIGVMLVPENINKVVMQSGMAREQRFLLHFHGPEESMVEIDNRSLIYQMPDLGVISPDVFRESGALMDVFPTKLDDDVEIALINRCDAHDRNYGMLNWGDSVDQGYTKQGRANGKPVYSNNEYDYPHACALQFARTGTRRFYDYMANHASHWMDVDVCHYSKDPLRIGGMWEHTGGHIVNGIMVCSHEWVEGLMDYYHFTGDERGLETAIGIGENVLRLLDTPMYAVPGEANARETGWALRALIALYVETNDKKWLSKCDWILDSFITWEKQYGHWLAPYTDNTLIRVGFMISVAIGSVMRYYRVFPRQDLKDMLIRAVDDLVDNCLLDNGLFYYKELPSLARNGNNTLLLESLAIAFELTADIKYLYPGFKTFKKTIGENVSAGVSTKTIIDDAVCVAGNSTKGFAQSFVPLITYYKALTEAGINYEDIR